MKTMIVAFIMLGFIGAGFLTLEKSDPTHTQNYATTIADAFADNALYYVNTAWHYAVDNPDTRSSGFRIEDVFLNNYMIDVKASNAAVTFESLNKHVAYISSSNTVNYVFVSWKNIDTAKNSYHPLGVVEDSYAALNGGIISKLTMEVDRQNQQNKNADIKKYRPYVVVGIIDTTKSRCDKTNFQIYSAEVQAPFPDADKKIRQYEDVYMDLCNMIGSDRVGDYVVFKQLNIQSTPPQP